MACVQCPVSSVLCPVWSVLCPVTSHLPIFYPSFTHLLLIFYPLFTHLLPILYPFLTHLLPVLYPSFTQNNCGQSTTDWSLATYILCPVTSHLWVGSIILVPIKPTFKPNKWLATGHRPQIYIIFKFNILIFSSTWLMLFPWAKQKGAAGAFLRPLQRT